MAEATRAPDGRRDRWTLHKAERRAHILDAAIEVIEEHEPGADIQIAQIADRAGLGRTVIYRHFDDRAGLERAVQGRVVELLLEEIRPRVLLEGSIEEIILRIIAPYVRWAGEHPALHRLLEREDPTTSGGDAVQIAMAEIANQVRDLIAAAAFLLGLESSEELEVSMELLSVSIVAAAFASTRHWSAKHTNALTADELAELTTQTIWYQVHGHAHRLGVELAPGMTVEDLAALGASSSS